jgi:hypothetical protein
MNLVRRGDAADRARGPGRARGPHGAPRPVRGLTDFPEDH